jgi:hypothetical protein
MGRTVARWTDARLDDLAAELEPVRARVAMLDVTVHHLDHAATALEPLPAQVAVLAATIDRLETDVRALRHELASTQQQLLQMAWALVVALLGAAVALVAAFV